MQKIFIFTEATLRNAVNNAKCAMCEAHIHYEVENIFTLLKMNWCCFKKKRSFFLAAFVTSDYKEALWRISVAFCFWDLLSGHVSEGRTATRANTWCLHNLTYGDLVYFVTYRKLTQSHSCDLWNIKHFFVVCSDWQDR